VKKIVFGALFALAILAIAIALRGVGNDGTSSAAARSGSAATNGASKKTSTEAVLSIAPSVRPALASVVKNGVTPLMREYYDSKNDQAIYKRLMAKETRTAEEEYVLGAILDRCADVTDRKENEKRSRNWKLGGDDARARFVASLSPRAPNRDQRIKAFDAINFDECEGMDAVKTTRRNILDLFEQSAAKGDPKAQIAAIRLSLDEQRRDAKGEADYTVTTKMTDAQIATWKGVFGSGDPRAIVDAVELLSFNSSMHLRGPDEAPIDFFALWNASRLVACDLGSNCGPDNRNLLQACAMQGQCDAADMRDYILFYGSTPSMSQLAIQYQARLTDVIQRGDWSYFTVVPGPAPGLAAFQRP